MAGLGFAIRRELAAKGFSEAAIRKLEQLSDFVDTVNRVIAVEGEVETINTAVDALQEEQEDQNLSLTSLDERIDAFEDLAPFVRQDQGEAWTAPAASVSRGAVPAYAAPTISNPPTQAEVQAIATQLAAVTSAVAGLVTDLQDNGALT